MTLVSPDSIDWSGPCGRGTWGARKQGRPEQEGNKKLPAERDQQQPAHAGRARMSRQPESAEGIGGRERAEEHRAHQARRQHRSLARAPSHDEIDVESDAYA